MKARCVDIIFRGGQDQSDGLNTMGKFNCEERLFTDHVLLSNIDYEAFTDVQNTTKRRFSSDLPTANGSLLPMGQNLLKVIPLQYYQLPKLLSVYVWFLTDLINALHCPRLSQFISR